MVDYINDDSIYDIGYDIVYNRDATKDVSINTTNYYTKSATPVVGMHLYTVEGVDTGKTIGTVSQNGDWDFGLYIQFVKGENVTDYTIDGTTYTADAIILLTEGEHTININGSTVNKIKSSYQNLETDFGLSPSTGTLYITNTTMYVRKSDDYELGPVSSIFTIFSTSTSGGGSN